MKLTTRFRSVAALAFAASIATMGLVNAQTSGASSAASGTLTFPEVQSTWTDPWVFLAGAQFNTVNAGFDTLSERPLYYFAAGNSTSFDYAVSEAKANPTWSNGNRTVTVTMQGNKWSNGESVNAASALFWINLEKWAAHPSGAYASEAFSYGAYAPNVGIPDQVTAASASGNKLTITFSSPVNTTWALDNALQVITPLPSLWDVASGTQKPGSAGCENNLTYSSTAPYAITGAGAVACGKVFNYLSTIAGHRGSNVTTAGAKNGVWKVSDGPYILASVNVIPPADQGGGVLPVFVPNKNYTGADKAQARYLVFKYFTSETAEVNALETGTYNLTTGGVPSADLTNGTLIANASQPSKCASADTLANGCNGAWAGSNKIGSIGSKYNVEFGSNWGTSYAYFNMTGHATHNALLQQAYIRRALNLTVNQSGLIQTVFHGYAAPDCNVLPQIDDPYENDTSCYGSANYSADKTEAATLLTSHGWTKQSGNYVCTSPGTGSSDCGANIASGSEININFEYLYSAGSDSATELTDLVADWHAFGINVTLDPVSQSQTILGDVFGTDPTYDIALYGGWVYNPGVFISGEQFVLGGSADNATGLNNPIINCSILNTIDLTEPAQCDSVSGFTWHNPSTSAGLMAAAHEYADVTGFTASTAQAPYLYLPNTFWGASEVSKSITWTGPKPDKAFGAKNYLGNPVVNFMPQWIKP